MRGQGLAVGWAALAAGLLSGCGGGGGSDVASTPTPVPSPSPSPSPPPAYKMEKFTDGVVNDVTLPTATVSIRTLPNDRYELVSSSPLGTSGPVLRFLNPNTPVGIGVRSQASNPAAGGAQEIYAASDFDVSKTPVVGIKRDSSGRVTSQLLVDSPIVNGVDLSYVRAYSWLRYSYADASTTTPLSIATDVMTVGFATSASEMPKSGSATYDASVYGSAIAAGKTYELSGPSTATFSANFGAGTVATTLGLRGREPGGNAVADFGTATGTGAIVSGGAGFSGILSGAGLKTGVFSGGFFGPQAAEMGYSFFFNGGDTFAGVVAGIKR